MKLLAFSLLLIGFSLLGALFTVRMRAGGAWWLAFLPAVASQAVWVASAKTVPMSLVVLSALFDVLVALAWFAGFAYWGDERISVAQGAGIVLLCTGLVLINWRS